MEALIGLHMVLYQEEWTDRAIRRLIQRAGENLDKLLDLVEADSASLRLRADKLRDVGKLRERVRNIRQAMPEPRSPLSGRQIMEVLGIEEGLSVGEAKNALIDAVVEGEIPPEEAAARQFLIAWYEKSHRES